MPRTKLTEAYLANMVTMLHANYPDVPIPQLEEFVKQQVLSHMKRPKVTLIHQKSPGNPVLETQDLWNLFHKHANNIIAPNGCIYQSSSKKVSVISQMVIDMLAARKKEKKQMLACKAVGDEVGAKKHHYAQATIKININSLPGGFGSAFNLFYDKGGYNTITSTARNFIAHAYTNTEELLGGNFSWYDEEELINWIVTHIRVCPSEEAINGLVAAMSEFKIPTRDELFQFYRETVKRYDQKTELLVVQNMLKNLPQYQITYLYYFNNLRHLVWDNEHIFKDWIRVMFDLPSALKYKQRNPENLELTADDLMKLDGDLLPMLAIGYNDILKRRQQWAAEQGIEDGEKMQLWDLPKKDPEGAQMFAWIGHFIQYCLNQWTDMFDIFIYNPLVVHRPSIRKHMYRNTVIISDTDSVIFTAKDWVQWYTGDVLKTTEESHQIGSLTIYWLTKVIEKVLNKASIAQGATKEFVYTIKMKNEFLYPTLILYPLKKTYAGIIAIQEGVVLPKPQKDIKGANLRGSDICKTTTDFVMELINDDILEPTLNGRISGEDIIRKVVNFEQQIKASLLNGSPEFLKVISVNPPNYYKSAESSNYFYFMAWNDIFSEKYGELRVPTKASVLQVLNPNPDYLKWLEDNSPDVYKKMMTFRDKYGKLSKYYTLNPLNTTIPSELIPIADIRAVIYHNIRPIYLTLARLGISSGCTKDRIILLSDLYDQ